MKANHRLWLAVLIAYIGIAIVLIKARAAAKAAAQNKKVDIARIAETLTHRTEGLRSELNAKMMH